MGIFNSLSEWVGKKYDERKNKIEKLEKERSEKLAIRNKQRDFVNWLLTRPEINDTVFARYQSMKSEALTTITYEENYRIEYLNLIWKLQNNLIPQLNWSDINIIPKKGELLHYLDRAILKEMKTKTTRVTYGGVTTSIKITKSIRYRSGSLNVDTKKTNYLDEVANGLFYITNQRVGFISKNKNFTIPINKILSINFDPSSGLLLFKEGREKPYIMVLNTYDSPCLLMSELISEN
ncbi:MAG: hypothetical protein SPL45_06120 [Schwartzia succinivorans]|nr:hypothetical protein [Schwartzia succinivorans]